MPFSQLSASTTEDAHACSRPQSRTELFMACSSLALQGFGGVMAIIQRELVERRNWYTTEEFVEEWAMAQILPGPNALILLMALGSRYFGLGGALAALTGMLLAPTALLLCIAAGYAALAQQPMVHGALRGMGAVASGVIMATGFKLAAALRHSVMGVAPCMLFGTLAFLAVAVLHWPLIWVVLGIGGCACAWAYTRLRQQANKALVTQDEQP